MKRKTKNVKKLNADLLRREKRVLKKAIGPRQVRVETPTAKIPKLTTLAIIQARMRKLNVQIMRDFMAGSSVERMAHKFSVPALYVETAIRIKMRAGRKPTGGPLCW